MLMSVLGSHFWQPSSLYVVKSVIIISLKSNPASMLIREFTPGQGGSPSKCISLVLILIVGYLGNTSSKPFLLPFFPRDCSKTSCFLWLYITHNIMMMIFSAHCLSQPQFHTLSWNNQQVTQVILITSL